MADLSIEILGSGAEPYIPPPEDPTLLFTGIASSQALGSAIIAADPTLLFTGIASSQALGSAIIAGPVLLAGIASSEAVGTFNVWLLVGPLTGLATSEAFGATQINMHVPFTGGPTSETIGTLNVGQEISLTGPSTSEAIGVHNVSFPPKGFARVSSISHVRIRFGLQARALPPSEAWTTGHDPTRHELVHRPAGQHVRLAIVAQTAPIVSGALPADPGPYASPRDGIVERVLQQTTIIIPSPVISELPRGDVIETGTKQDSTPVRLRGPNGRFIALKTGEGALISTKSASGAAVVTTKTNIEGTTVRTGKAQNPKVAKASGASGPRVRTGKAQNPNTPPTKPRGSRVRTKK